MSQLRHRQEELEALGVRVALVTFEGGALARTYVSRSALPWTALVDEGRSLYHSYGMERARLWDLLGPHVWGAYASGMIRGHLPRIPHADVSQRGGDVLIDPSGTVRLHWVGNGPADRPPVGLLLERVRGAGSRR